METILAFLGPFGPYLLGALAAIAGLVGWKIKSSNKKADKATAEAAIQRQRADSMDAATKAQTAAQDAARGVPKPAPANASKRGGLRGSR